MGATIAKGALGLVFGLGILVLIVVLLVAYVPGFEQFFTGMTTQIVKWAHQLNGSKTTIRSPIGPG